MEARFACDSFFVGTVCNSPLFLVQSPTKRWGLTTGCTPLACVLSYAMHYTRKFGRCPILNKIHYEDTKYLATEGTEGAERGFLPLIFTN